MDTMQAWDVYVGATSPRDFVEGYATAEAAVDEVLAHWAGTSDETVEPGAREALLRHVAEARAMAAEDGAPW